MPKITLFLVWISLGILGCQTTSPMPPKPESRLVPQTAVVSGDFVLGMESDTLKLSDGTTIELIYEGSSTTGLLTHPGLRWTRPKLPDDLTGGLGLFYVHERPVVVERIEGDFKTPPHLRIKIGLPHETWTLMPVQDAVQMAVKRVQDEGIAYSRYSWNETGNKLNLLLHHNDSDQVIWLVVDRFHQEIDAIKKYTVPNILGLSAHAVVTKQSNTHVVVNATEGTRDARRALSLIQNNFAECSMENRPTEVDVVVDDYGNSIFFEWDENTFGKFQATFKACFEDILNEVELEPVTFQIQFKQQKTIVEQEFLGHGKPSIQIARGSPVTVKVTTANPQTRQELRQMARAHWQTLLTCQTEGLSLKGKITQDGTFLNNRPVKGCLADIVSTWKFEPRLADENVAFRLHVTTSPPILSLGIELVVDGLKSAEFC